MAKQKEGHEEEVEAGSAGESRVYELGFRLDPELGAEEVKRAYNELRAAVTKAGEVVAEGEPEKVALAYTISRGETAGRRDFDSAYFCWVAYEATPEAHEAVVAAAKADTRIIRYLDIVTDKEAARAAAERAELAQKSAVPTESEEAEEPASEDAALDVALENAAL